MIKDDDLTNLMHSPGPKEEGWLIAEGTPPRSGEDAKIIYHFDPEAHKVGTVRESGIIDFKDKGEIQQVKEGDLLAEKVPLVKEVPGKDVFGQLIPVDKAQDVLLLAGENTKASEDGLKVIRQDRRAAGPGQRWPDLRLSGTENRGGRGIGDRPHPV